ncbi:MAG: rhomboid family intramembrane serine protease [Phycisphaerae bacterium]
MGLGVDLGSGLGGIAAGAAVACAVRIQQALLRAGWGYVDGDVARWPLAPVTMQKGSSAIVLAVWNGAAPSAMSELSAMLHRCGGGYNGLLLVGEEPCQADGVQRLFTSARGTLAYIDAVRGVFRLHRRWMFDTQALAPLRKGNLRRLLDQREAAKSANIDCRTAMAEQLEALRSIQAFQQQAKALAGRPRVTYILMAACVAVFGAMLLTAGPSVLSDPPTKLLLDWGADYGPLVRAGQWWRIVTCSFLHIGLVHLFFNMMAMLYFGWLLEAYQGSWRTAFFYFFSVVTASLASIWWSPQSVSAGASGGLFGMLGATAAILLRYWRVFPPQLRKSLRGWLATVLIYNVFWLVTPRIDSAAHVGGFIGGLAIGIVLARSPLKIDWPPMWTWGALAGLVVAVMFFAQHAVARVPAHVEVPGQMTPGRPMPDQRSPELVAMDEIAAEQRALDEMLPMKRLVTLPKESQDAREEVATNLAEEVLPAMEADLEKNPQRQNRIGQSAPAAKFMEALANLQNVRMAYYREVLHTLQRHPKSCPVLAVQSPLEEGASKPNHIVILQTAYYLANMNFGFAHTDTGER